MQDLAATEKIHPSYLSRVLWLTLLAPDIVEAILDGRQPPTAIQAHYPVTSDERKLVAAMLAEGQKLDSNILLSPVRRTRIFYRRRCRAAARRSGNR